MTSRQTQIPVRRLIVTALLATMTAIFIACGSTSSEATVIVRLQARISGILIEQDGCLRLADSLEPGAQSAGIVWQKHVFEISRVGDQVRIVELFGDSDRTVIWRIGEQVVAGGAPDFRRSLPAGWDRDTADGAAFPERCEGPYDLVSTVDRDSEPVLPQ